ncbi:MAG: ATP-binding protein [Gemmatimonadaceae bacterium]
MLYRLRQDGIPIEANADQLRLSAQRVTVDWRGFLEASPLDEIGLQSLSNGIFPGYHPTEPDGYREWFEAERSNISRKLSRHITTHLPQLRAAGRWDLVASAANALLALDSLSEEGTLARAEALAMAGSKSAALRVIDQYMIELGETQPHLRLAPSSLRSRISERLPEASQRALDDRLFVGRDETMGMLNGMGRSCRDGKQQVLFVWGEPGIGKTRLLTEYRSLAALQGFETFLVSSQAHDAFRPLGIACDLIALLLQAPGSLGCDPSARALLERLVSVNKEIGAQRDIDSDETPIAAIVRSLSDLVSAVSTEYPVLVVVDDAQWLDERSLSTILGCFTGTTARRACLVMASRQRTPSKQALEVPDGSVSVRLGPLPDAAALELTRSLLKCLSISDRVRAESYVMEEARGNPFFIRLLCSHLNTTADRAQLNNSIEEVLRSRLDQLSKNSRRVLEGTVVLGKNCTFGRLEDLLRMRRPELLAAIEELDDRALVQLNESSFVATHALLGEAVTKRIAKAVLRALHAAAARLLQLDAQRHPSSSLPWDCAEHWRLANEPSQAVNVLRACAQGILEVGRPMDALQTFRRALALPSNDKATRLDLLERAAMAAAYSAYWSALPELIAEVKQLRTEMNRSAFEHDGVEILEMILPYHLDGDPRINISRLQECTKCESADPLHRIAAARHLIAVGELTLTRELADDAYVAVGHEGVGSMERDLCDLLYHTCFGSASDANSAATMLVDKAFASLPKGLAYALNAGYAQYRVGDSDEAAETLLRGYDAAKRSGSCSAQVIAALLLARLAWSRGRVEDSKVWLRRYMNLNSSYPQIDAIGDGWILGARLAIEDGRLDEAGTMIGQARQSHQASLALPKLLIGSCEIQLRLARKDAPCTDDELREFLSLYERAKSLGCQDEVVLALVQALEYRGAESDAKSLLGGYLSTARRDGFPLLRRLAAIVDVHRRSEHTDNESGMRLPQFGRPHESEAGGWI